AQVAYAAGFYDGEGSCSINNYGKTRIRAAQKNPEVLYWLRDWFGGSIDLRHRKAHAGICASDIYEWGLSGERACKFIHAIYSYVSTRRKMQLEKSDFRTYVPWVEAVKEPKAPPLMTAERKALRSSMTPEEKLRESQDWYAKRNAERLRHANMMAARKIFLRKKEENQVIQ